MRREFEGGALRDDGCMRVRIGLAIVLRASPCTRRVRLLIGPGLGRWRIDDACAAARLWRARRLGPLGRLAIPCRLPYAKGPRGFELCAFAPAATARRAWASVRQPGACVAAYWPGKTGRTPARSRSRPAGWAGRLGAARYEHGRTEGGERSGGEAGSEGAGGG